jgi:uncharacterized protein
VRELPMFPLGTVLFPHMVLPLHVFEPRYRVLAHDVLAGEREFGVVLISRGHEVGGGDQRTDVGTVARVLRADELEDGRWLLVGLGADRFRVAEWLDDEPYPRARVVPLEDEHEDADVATVRSVLVPRVREVLALQARLGDDGPPPDFELADDPEVACWQVAVMSPLNPFDAQRVLATARCGPRLALLDELLEGLEEALRFRVSTDDQPPP